ncbi:metapyrocatechase [Citreicella sp. SE45]|nr:metapyrocatechase [Citreicella sp. SE45]
MKDIRRAEAERAGEALGVHELVCLDMRDATDQREDILRAADIFLQNGVHIETGPHKHAIEGTFFLYAGNRVELVNAGARLILAPDWPPVKWREADRMEGQAWGLKTIESFHTHGTPPVER